MVSGGGAAHIAARLLVVVYGPAGVFESRRKERSIKVSHKLLEFRGPSIRDFGVVV